MTDERAGTARHVKWSSHYEALCGTGRREDGVASDHQTGANYKYKSASTMGGSQMSQYTGLLLTRHASTKIVVLCG